MKKMPKISIKNLSGVMIAFLVMAHTSDVFAHCDTLAGPVVAEARQALVTGDVIPVLKWVLSDEEDNIKAAFKHTLAVRQLGDEARNLADTYFFETLVRIHRAGEGVPYSGLQPDSSVDPAVTLADKAIEKGSVEQLTNVLNNALKSGLTSRFEEVLSSRKHADESVAEGRNYVEAYVKFTHFAEGVHQLMEKEGQHGEHN